MSYNVAVSPTLLKRRGGSGGSASGSSASGGTGSIGDVMSIRYGFHPDSLDHDSKMELDTNDAKGGYVLSGKSTHGGNEDHVFSGGLTTNGDLDCVLVWDASKKEYVLHGLDSTLRVTRDKSGGSGSGSGGRGSATGRTSSPESNDGTGGLGISLPGAGVIVSEEELRRKRVVEGERAREEARVEAALRDAAQQEAEEARMHAEEAARLERELMDSDEDDIKETLPPKKAAPKAAPKKTAPKKAASKAASAPKKAAPSRPSMGGKKPPTQAVELDDDDEDDFGDLANELEESLEAFSKDDDGDVMMVVDDSHSKPAQNWGQRSGAGGPMSLRGYAGGRREEEELSSSEEE